MTTREEFEKWVGNSYLLNRMTEPGFTDEYEHPWTDGAWVAWEYLTLKHRGTAPNGTITKEQWDNACAGLGTKA